jgi:hypothetical protein
MVKVAGGSGADALGWSCRQSADLTPVQARLRSRPVPGKPRTWRHCWPGEQASGTAPSAVATAAQGTGHRRAAPLPSNADACQVLGALHTGGVLLGRRPSREPQPEVDNGAGGDVGQLWIAAPRKPTELVTTERRSLSLLTRQSVHPMALGEPIIAGLWRDPQSRAADRGSAPCKSAILDCAYISPTGDEGVAR